MNMPRTKLIPNGDNIVHTFSDKEYQNRQDSLRKHMASSNIDAVIFTSIHGINYYSDFLYCSFGRPYALVITQDKATTVTANIDGGQPWRRTFGENLVYTDWQKDSFFYALQQLVKNSGKIGIEYDHITKERLDKLQDAFNNAAFIDISVDCMRMRSIKSDEEIAHIINGANVCDIGGAALVEAVKEGAPEHEVALHSTQAMVREIAKRYPHSELMDTWTWFQSGINTDGAHNPKTNKKLINGDILSLNTFPMISGYYTALERTLFLDHADDASLKAWEANVKVHKRGLELIKPGVKCSDICHELNELFAELGYLHYRTFGYGHSFGVLSHFYGREAGLELREDIDTVLEENMVISMEPMIMIPEGNPGAGGYREHDILVIGKDGAENITKFPFGPEHNIIKN